MKNNIILTFVLLIIGIGNVFAIRVVSLSPIASKSLILLEAEDQVVACTQWCPFADKKMVVANAIDVNVEQVLRAKPDVVFASTLTSSNSIATIEDLGIEVVVLPKMTSFEVMCQNLQIIGDKIGKREKASIEVEKAKNDLATIKSKIPEKSEKPRIMFQVGAKPIFVAIPNTFVNDYITQAGAVNIFDDLEHGTVTRESVLKRNPEAIFISTMPTSASDAQAAWMSYKELDAAQHNSVILIDQEIASSPTIHTFVDVVEIIINALY